MRLCESEFILVTCGSASGFAVTELLKIEPPPAHTSHRVWASIAGLYQLTLISQTIDRGNEVQW